jgi:hydrogenase maturation protease
MHFLQYALPEAGSGPPLTVIGVGNAWRGDDAAGLEVAKRLREVQEELRVIQHEGDQSRLVDLFGGSDLVVVVDAAHSGAPAGTVFRFDAADEPLPAPLLRGSTHAFGVAEAVELARALGRLPRELIVYAIEGQTFETGAGLTPEVERAVEEVVEELTPSS